MTMNDTMTTSTQDVDGIARRAREAFTLAARTPAEQREEWLTAVADALDAATAELVQVAVEETHLPEPRLVGEVARTTGQLRLFARVVREGSYLEATIDHAAPPQPDLRRMLRPIGPVAVFAASNFPFAFSVAGGDTASALAVGCPVVVKAHPAHARLSRRTAAIVGEALRSVGAPDGLFALIEGYDAGVELVQHPDVAAVAFTGSVAGGRALADLVSAREVPIPFFGELGSINPVIVSAAADAARGADLAEGLVGSFTLGTGQFCTKPGIVFVPQRAALEEALPPLVGGPTSRMLSESIASGFEDGLSRLLSVAGVDRIAGSTAADAEGAAPVVLATDVDTLVRHPRELLAEVFGPVTLLVRYGSDEELDVALGQLEGSLTATVHAEPGEDVTSLVHRLEVLAGRVLFDGWPTGVAVAWSQHHGGPWPSTNTQFTSVGATAVRRFLRPVAYQDAPERVLPDALKESNPLRIPRRIDGVLELGG
jgi:NADP-dependent aldehyde dehydrogenase